MKKRARFLIILAVLGFCFYCLWPSIQWYFYVPEEDKQFALLSLENIRDRSEQLAIKAVQELEQEARTTPDAVPAEKYEWLIKEAKDRYKKYDKELPSEMTYISLYQGFCYGYNSPVEIHNNLVLLYKDHFREKVLKNKKYYSNSVKLGLDLAGGVNVIVRADLDKALEKKQANGNELSSDEVAYFKQQAMKTAIETITSSIDRFGLTEPVIRQQGEDKIYIEIPGAGQNEAMNAIIQGKGLLHFRLVDDAADDAFRAYRMTNINVFDENGNLIDPSVIPEDCEILGYYDKDEFGLDQFKDWIVVKNKVVSKDYGNGKIVELDGTHIQNVNISRDKMGQVGVDLSLDYDASMLFGEVTAENVGKRLAIINDNRVKSAPVIKGAIPGGNVRVDGFGIEEAQNLKKVLESAALEVELEVESQQVIGATLGAMSVKQGLYALIIGLSLIIVFMLIFYKGAGFNAVLAQVLNLFIVFSILSGLNLTLTLPGIAGMILTIGMAVDANVIIFERIKEELRLGKSRGSSIEAGFDGAFWAIMDSNITTFIAALFLSILGTGSIQGFAVTLAIGVLSSVFTALFVSRLIFDVGTEQFHRTKVGISWRIK